MKRKEIISKSYKGILVVFVVVGLQYTIGFVVQVVLARFLIPEIFGAFALVFALVMFFSTFISFNGDKYLVQEENDIEEQLSSVFNFSLLSTLIVTLLTLVVIPFIMDLKRESSHTHLAQILTILFFYNPLILPRVLFEKNLSFFVARYPLILSQLLGGFIAIFLAYQGFGIWSLVWWKIMQLGVEVVIIWMITSWKPQMIIDLSVIKKCLKFGLPITLAGTMVFFTWNIDYYVVDYFLGSEQLGYYYLAFQSSHYFLKAKTAVNTVVFPMYSQMKSLKDRIKAMEYLCDLLGFLYLIPVVFFMFLGKDIVELVFGDSWLPSVGVFKIFFIIVLLRAIGGNAGPLLYAHGITVPDLKLSMLNIILLIPFLFLGCTFFGIYGAALAIVFMLLISGYYGFQKYVFPITGNGYFYYYLKPLLITILSVLLAHTSYLFESGRFIHIMLLSIVGVLIIAVYYNLICNVYARISAQLTSPIQ